MPKLIVERQIELVRCVGGDSGTWGTVFVNIPATTHPNSVALVAIKKAQEEYGNETYAIYNTYDGEVPEVKGAFIIEVQANVRCVQRFLVTGAANEEEALEMMGKGQREQHGPDEIMSVVASFNDYKVTRWGQ